MPPWIFSIPAIYCLVNGSSNAMIAPSLLMLTGLNILHCNCVPFKVEKVRDGCWVWPQRNHFLGSPPEGAELIQSRDLVSKGHYFLELSIVICLCLLPSWGNESHCTGSHLHQVKTAWYYPHPSGSIQVSAAIAGGLGQGQVVGLLGSGPEQLLFFLLRTCPQRLSSLSCLFPGMFTSIRTKMKKIMNVKPLYVFYVKSWLHKCNHDYLRIITSTPTHASWRLLAMVSQL